MSRRSRPNFSYIVGKDRTVKHGLSHQFLAIDKGFTDGVRRGKVDDKARAKFIDELLAKRRVQDED